MSIFPAKILLATDGSYEAELARVTAVDMATSTDSELHVVHVGVVPAFLENYSGTLGYDRKIYEEMEEESRELLRKLTWQVKVAGGSVAGTYFRVGTVELEIVNLAEELGADLIVVGCRGHRGIRTLIEGSISAAVIRHAPCPVLVVRSHKSDEGPRPRDLIHVGRR